jgi:lipopolysaccharide/colanic/teichoic acid biosynthesis glycosyltransferase
MIDIIFALIGLIVLLPLMLTVALIIRIKLGENIFFRQPRLGQGGKIFCID